MGDVFKEQLVKKIPSLKDKLIKAALIMAGFFITVIVAFLMFELVPIVVAAIAFGIYYVFVRLNKEFEYIFTNGDLDIDCIYGKSRRKRMLSCDIKEIMFMTHASNRNYDHERELATAKTVMDCSSGIQNDNTYIILTLYKGNRVKLLIEPNETLLKAIQPYLGTRKFFKKQ